MKKGNDLFPIIDFHSHILPGVDHGSDSVKTSLEMLAQAANAGVVGIVATPHYYAHEISVEHFLEKRDAGYRALQKAIQGTPLEKIKIFRGAEVALEQKLIENGEIEKLVIEGTDTLLLEMPQMGLWQGWMYDAVYEIPNQYHVSLVIAHIDRYLKSNLERLLNMGVTAQINASSLFDGSQKKFIRNLCHQGLVNLLGSDAHDPQERNYADLEKAQKKLDRELLNYFYRNARELLPLDSDSPRKDATLL